MDVLDPVLHEATRAAPHRQGANSSTGRPAVVDSPPREVLTFCLGNEEYGINILQVQEIRRYEVPTRIANAAPCLKGVMNLRGVIVPIIDLRLKLGLREVGCDGTTATVVLNLSRGTVGVVVDAVRDVLEIAPSMVKPPPMLDQMAVDVQFLTGIATLSTADGQPDRLLLLTDIEALVQAELGLASGLDS